ncbi:MAG: hypothetical protein J3K34DRAFT_482510 [Monoraphidium minutum]|nr:MAG: hypothetical protein J3K34DRAFT_482510 [Monoraphidium minutum]
MLGSLRWAERPLTAPSSGRAAPGALRPTRAAARRSRRAPVPRRGGGACRAPPPAAIYDKAGPDKWYEELEVEYLPQWPNPDFIAEVREAFEGTYGKEVADPEEARVLIADGFTLLDVRSQAQVDAAGKPRGAVHVPFTLSSKRYDAEAGKTIVTTRPNPDFLKEVARRFPDAEAARLLVADADGRPDSGAMAALEALDDAGYGRLVGMVGGFRRFLWFFDMKLARRPPVGAFVEDPWAEGSSQGMFAGES